MKKSLTYVTLVAGTAFSLLSCQKANSVRQEIEDKKNKNKDLCLITSFSYSNSAVPLQTIFTNQFDFSGRSLEVEAGIFSGGAIVDNKPFSIVWTSSGLAFLDANAVQDTILIASFNRKGRIEKIFPGNKPSHHFLPTTFQYSNNRLSSMGITLAGNVLMSYFDYDHKGNIRSITDAPSASVPVPGKVEYKYATNEKANNQFYFDEPRKFSWNSFTLLQYIGLFPELDPSNLRTSTKVDWGNNYIAYNMNINNHQLDQQGKLVSYDIVSPGSGSTISHYNINWSCNQSLVNNAASNQ
jgi:hypothetical protein